MDHPRILELLLGLKQKQSVHLIAREVVAGAQVTAGQAWFFIPDLHLLSRAATARYTYSFARNPGGAAGREALLLELCEGLSRLHTAGSLFVYQLGDLIDIWREDAVMPREDVASMLRRVLDDNPAAARFLADEQALKTFLVLGNHDHVSGLSLQAVPATRRMAAAFALPPAGNVVVTHGDAFDPIERLPDPFSRWGARFTTFIGPSTHKLLGAREIRSFIDIPGAHGVQASHPLLPGAVEFAHGLRQGNERVLRRLQLQNKRPLRIFVIGHTHQPRITSVPGLTIMDCGAWLEQSELKTGVVPSCHVGVIAQASAGVDLRVYQLTPK